MDTFWNILQHAQGVVLLLVMFGIVGFGLYVLGHNGQVERLVNDPKGTHRTDEGEI